MEEDLRALRAETLALNTRLSELNVLLPRLTDELREVRDRLTALEKAQAHEDGLELGRSGASEWWVKALGIAGAIAGGAWAVGTALLRGKD